MPKRNVNLKPPLTTPELRELYRRNPTPELARALWEVARLKHQIDLFSQEYVRLVGMWPRDAGGRPVLLETLKSRMLVEVREAWPAPRHPDRPPVNFTAGTKFADLDDDHPEDLYLIRQWERKHGRPFEG